ncbi:MAG: glycosyltransferase family 2 protein [bacterium]|nr:glycosyltransferase family 2 protein [bacterium]
MRQSGSGAVALSIIIPAHNEERRIAKTLEDIRRELPDAEICVVANNCADRTVELLAEMAQRDAALRYTNIPAAIGKGGAVRAGFKLAHGEVVAFVDADGATPGAELRRLYALMDGRDGVIASRWKRGAIIETRQSFKRRILSRGFNLIVRTLFRLPYSDTQCGAKLFRRSAIADAIELLETSDFAFDVDLLYQLRRLGKTVVEVPSRWRDRAGSSVDVKRAVPRMFASMVRLRLKYSPFRALVPLIDRVAKLRPIPATKVFHVLICSKFHPHDERASKMERDLAALCAGLQGGSFRFTWCAASLEQRLTRPVGRVDEVSIGSQGLAKLALPLVYLSELRDRFDCIVELCPSGRLWWTPLFSLKPKVVFAPLLDRLPSIYGTTPLIRKVPEATGALAELIETTVVRQGPRFCAQADGSWVLLEHRADSPMRRLPLSALDGVSVNAQDVLGSA